MPISDAVFEPKTGDKFVRSLSELAYSDREIKEMRDWVEQCDTILLNVISELAKCLSMASNSMRPVDNSSNWTREPCTALGTHQNKLVELTGVTRRLAEIAEFPKLQFYERHFIPSGGMPDGLRPREFDQARNSEHVFDTARAAAILRSKESQAAAAKAKQEATMARQAADLERARVDEQAALFDEYVDQISSQARKRFKARISDPKFFESAAGVTDAVSQCIAGAGLWRADKLAEGERLLHSAVGADKDLRDMVNFYFDNAAGPVSDLVKTDGLPSVNSKKGLLEIAKLRRRFDKWFAGLVETPKATKKSAGKNNI